MHSECFRMLQNASECFRSRQIASKCFQMLQNAPECFRMLPNASECFTEWHVSKNVPQNASKNAFRCSECFKECFAECLQMLPTDSGGFRPLRKVSECFKMRPQNVYWMFHRMRRRMLHRMLPNVSEGFRMLQKASNACLGLLLNASKYFRINLCSLLTILMPILRILLGPTKKQYMGRLYDSLRSVLLQFVILNCTYFNLR